MENYKSSFPFIVGQEYEFNVYGYKLTGKYLSMIADKVVKIEVVFDETESTDVGCTANVDESFLIRS